MKVVLKIEVRNGKKQYKVANIIPNPDDLARGWYYCESIEWQDYKPRDYTEGRYSIIWHLLKKHDDWVIFQGQLFEGTELLHYLPKIPHTKLRGAYMWDQVLKEIQEGLINLKLPDDYQKWCAFLDFLYNNEARGSRAFLGQLILAKMERPTDGTKPTVDIAALFHTNEELTKALAAFNN